MELYLSPVQNFCRLDYFPSKSLLPTVGGRALPC
uniref:Uncharacterized protein n=1 Tax=Anguilla anguilla TaxID=7936 RepID=A0A0E9UXW9_ANGAN